MNKKNLFILAAVSIFLVTGIISPVSAKDKIVNGIDANFPPFAYLDKTGEPAGFDVEAMNWIAEKNNLEVTHKPVEWNSIIQTLLTGKIDVIASGMSITEKRAEKVDFTIPYWKIKQVMVVPEDSQLTVKNIMKGNKKIGAQKGTPEAEWLKDNEGKNGFNYALRIYKSSPLAVQDILNGRIVAAAMNDAPAKDICSKKEVRILGQFGMHAEDFGYAVKKGDKELLKMMNEGIKALKASPRWDELVEKYNP